MVKTFECGSFKATVDAEIPCFPIIAIQMPDALVTTEFSERSGIKSWADVLKEEIDKLYASVHAFAEEKGRRGEDGQGD